MPYTKQNFVSNEILYASQLNAMDDELYALSEIVEVATVEDVEEVLNSGS